ncbi:MAG: hypothetical protein P9M14_11695 [Candidatus Alcyoniella australis]|nr:hypothetical protein [Candidatus Alcyoniella australis]
MFSNKYLLLMLLLLTALMLVVGCAGSGDDDDDDTGGDDDDDTGPGDPPSIDHTPLNDQPAGFGVYYIRATIIDNSAVASAAVVYSISGSAETTLAMEDRGEGLFVGAIPDQPAGANVSYRISASDDHDQSSQTENYTFNVLGAVEVLLDDGSAEDGLRAIAAGDSLLVGMAMPIYPVKPARVRIKVHVNPDDAGVAVSGVLFADPSAAGPVGEPTFVSEPQAVQSVDAWLDIDVTAADMQVDSGNLILGVTSADGKTPFVGLDTSGFAGSAWYGRSGPTYTPLGSTPFANNLMIRAIVMIPGGDK